MCGIAGAFLIRPGRPLDPEALLPMIAVLAHRGPDDWGHYLDERRRVLLLHSRLSIVDLEHGHQPLSNEDGSVWVICNGEIYGFQQLARELQARGHRFRTRCDSEVIVHLYEEYGEQFVEHLRGEFAFALYDLRRDRLLLVRDRFGIKPLYYAQAGNSLIFGSEMKALLAHPEMRAAFNREYVFNLLGGLVLPGETLLQCIRQVEPGCLLRAGIGEPQQVRYWDLSFGRLAEEQAAEKALDPEAATEEFRRLFEEAVALRLHGDVEVGLYLSGGIDSAAVGLLMAQQRERPVQAFTISFADPAYDELAPARTIAQAGGMEQHVLHITPGGLAEHFERSLWHSEMPTFNGQGVAKFLLSELAAQHVKVVLTGQGADELLAGYDPFEHQLVLDAIRNDPKKAAALRRQEALRPHSGKIDVLARARSYPAYERVVERFGAYPYPMMRPLLHHPRMRQLLAPDFRQAVAATDAVDEVARRVDCSRISGRSSTSASQYLLFKTDLPGYILSALVDRPEMAHSIEGRLPFLDHRLAEFATQLPLSMKLQERENKHILRRAMTGLVPDEVRTRPKQQFLTPSSESLGLHLPRNPLVATYLTPERIRDAGIFDPARLKVVLYGVRHLPQGSYYQVLCEAIVMAALSLHILHDQFCRDFRGAADRYTKRGFDYTLRPPAAV